MYGVAVLFRTSLPLVEGAPLDPLVSLVERLGARAVVTASPGGRRLSVAASSPAILEALAADLATAQGLVPGPFVDAETAHVERDGVLPERFCVTTHRPTFVRVAGVHVPVSALEMDVAIAVRRGGPAPLAQGVPMHRARAGDEIVVGHSGVSVASDDALSSDSVEFAFMQGGPSRERAAQPAIARVVAAMARARRAGREVLLVAGPAVVHRGAVADAVRLVEHGHVQRVFGGNALAAHDVELALFGTSLGVSARDGHAVAGGHAHHLWAINEVRRAGNLRAAVESGLVRSGLVHACVRRGVPLLLAGSIRDDGPLPDVLTNTVEAVDAMRDGVRDVGVALLVATTLHSIAVGNLLAVETEVFCVDANAEIVTKLVDRGTHHAHGIVTDCAHFLGALADACCR